MSGKFRERFDIVVEADSARRMFVNRAHNLVFEDFVRDRFEGYEYRLERAILTHLGDRAEIAQRPLARKIGEDFYRNLQALEALYRSITHHRDELDTIIQ